MEEIQIDSSSKNNAIDMEDLEGSSSGGSTFGSSQGVYSRTNTAMHDDYYSDLILSIYKKTVYGNDVLKYSVLAMPPALILVFSILVSNSMSTLITFSAWCFSVLFIAISFWMLCEILLKD